MKKTFLLIPVFIFFSCKQKFYRAGASSMEKTLMTSQQFLVTETDEFNRNDIAVFNIYEDDYNSRPDEETGMLKKTWQKWVYRLIAFSGDTIHIKNGDVYVNGKPAAWPPKAMMEYTVTSDSFIEELENRGPEFGSIVKTVSGYEYRVPLTNKEAEKYNQMPGVKKVKKEIMYWQDSYTGIASPDTALHWTIDNYGPLRIPSPGDTLLVDTMNISLYRNLPGIQQGKYLLKEKLFFFMGDNRHRAKDSRYAGFIPQSAMYGVVK